MFASLWIAGCGKDICFGCSPNSSPTPGSDSVTVMGNLKSLGSSAAPFGSVLITVCVGLDPSEPFNQCTNPATTQANNDGTFERSDIDPGSERIAFWIDANVDGQIDSGDPFAELQDPRSELRNVLRGQIVTVADALVDFDAGTATADISVNTPTPTPTSTATPAATAATPTPLPTGTP
jgi:hypothetical protein